MPLSEQEQRLLDEMERSLYHGDADFVASVGRVRTGVNYTTLVVGVLLAIAGIGGLLLGVLWHSWPVGVVGFAAMFGGVLLAVGAPGRRVLAAPRPGHPAAGGRRAPFMDRISARWEQRRRQG